MDASVTPGGLLLPRVALVATYEVAPLSAHIAGMAVYNTATTPGADGVSPGYYFNDGDRWVRIAASSGAIDDWKLTGNAGTNANNNFIGTTDNQPFRVRTNNVERFEFTDNGRLRSFHNGGPGQPTYSWVDRSNTGMWSQADNVISFSTNGTEKFRIPNAEQVHAMRNGTAAAPFYSWSSDSDLGMYRIGNNTLGFSTNGNERFRILEDGRVIVNNTAAFNSFASGTSMAIAARSINGDAIYADTQGEGNAIVGIATGSGRGVYAESASSNQMAIISAGNNVGAVEGGFIGLGNAFSGSTYGGGGFGRSSASTGFIGVGNAGLLTVNHPDGSGLAGTGNRIGIYGHALYGEVGSSNNGNAGGSFSLGTDGGFGDVNKAYAKLAGYHRGQVIMNPQQIVTMEGTL